MVFLIPSSHSHIMENVSLCSVCGRDEASFFCVCTPALLTLCNTCSEKHSNSPGFHYCLPIARMVAISAQSQQVWKTWLMNLSDSQKESVNSLGGFSTLREGVINAFAFAVRSLEDQRDQLVQSIDNLWAVATKAVDAAVQETYENSMNADYQPTSDLSALVWCQAYQRSASFTLFSHRLDVSEDALLNCVKLGMDFCVKELEECQISQELKTRNRGTAQKCEEPCPPILVLETLPGTQVFPRVLLAAEKSAPEKIVERSSVPLGKRPESGSIPSSRPASVRQRCSFSAGGIWSCGKCSGANLEPDTSCMHCQATRAPSFKA